MADIENYEIESLEQLRQSKLDAKYCRKLKRGRLSKNEKLIVETKTKVTKKRSKTRFVTIELIMRFD